MIWTKNKFEDRERLEMQTYLAFRIPEMSEVEMVKFNSMHWWKENKHSLTLLLQPVHNYLNVPATYTSIERLFSLAGNILAKNARLLAGNVKMLSLSIQKI